MKWSLMKNPPSKTKFPPAALLILCLIMWGCQSNEKGTSSTSVLKLTLAVSSPHYSALIAIADEKGYFKAEGLDVALTSHASGLEALEMVCLGKAQVATVADIAFSAKVTEDPSIRVLASIGTIIGSQIVARKDRKIHDPVDLKGKRVGYSAGTVSDYFLYAFLISEDIPLKEVTAVNLPPARQTDAVVNGEVDAVSAFELFAYEAKKRLGANAVSWDSQNNLAYHWLLATNEAVIQSPEPLKRLLKALLKAEAFVRDHEAETKSVLVRRWGFDPDFLSESWPTTRLNVSFNQSIVISLQNYAVWQRQKESKEPEPPDVLNYLHTGILDAVAPGKVTIFR
jgi:ABC-type nitrate/sulfonate/bicarbonate transport system substrate-binding protein